MSRIITLTLSPALDKSTSVPSIFPDKKLSCRPPRFDAGGGGVNVARVLKRLGDPVVAVFPSGGHSGRYFCDLLQIENVSFETINSQHDTRENFMVLDESTDQPYRFGMPPAELTEWEWKECLNIVATLPRSEFLVISGSWPDTVPLDFMEDIAHWAAQQSVKLVIDTSGEALKKALEINSFMIKPNLGELAMVSGKPWIQENEVVQVCREWLSRNNTEVLVVSLGKEGALLVTENEMFQAKPPSMEKKSTVGAGDSMVAGLLHALLKGMPLSKVLQYGVACGASATLHPGTELCKLEDIQSIIDQMQ